MTDVSDATTAAIADQLTAEGNLPEGAFVVEWVTVARWQTDQESGIACVPSMGTAEANLLREAQAAIEAR